MTRKTAPTKPETYTLLIWEDVPERTTLYLIPNSEISALDARIVLRKAHGEFVNGTDDADVIMALDKINNALCKDAEHLSEDYPVGSPWAMCWAKFKVDEGVPIENASITHVYFCGFLC